MKKLLALLLTVVLLFSGFSIVNTANAEDDLLSDEMMRMILQMFGIDEETAKDLSIDELQELINDLSGVGNSDLGNDKNEITTSSFDENVFTSAGYSVLDDVFSAQKVFYRSNSNISFLTYNTRTIFFGMSINTKIFGKAIKEDGELPAWTDGDSSEFHTKQKNVKFYPCIVYNPNHSVPYSFVVSLSFPKSGKNDWLGMQSPYSIMIATDKNVYTLNRYLPSEKSWYAGTVFLTVDETMMQMFLDIETSKSITIRATAHDTERVSFSVKADCVKGISEAWTLYEKAGGTKQDLSTYNGSIEVRKR